MSWHHISAAARARNVRACQRAAERRLGEVAPVTLAPIRFLTLPDVDCTPSADPEAVAARRWREQP